MQNVTTENSRKSTLTKWIMGLAFLAFSLTTQATHIMGGEITLIDVGNDKYFVNLLLYRDANPGTAPMPSGSTTLDIENLTSGVLTSVTIAEDPVLSGAMIPFFPYNVEFYYYRDTITLSAVGDYSIRWESCCRNGAIVNLSNPLGEGTTIETRYIKTAGVSNSTPVFIVPASVYLAENTPWTYNPLPFDIEGDSLFWSITDPLGSNGVPCAGWTIPAGDPTNPFTLDTLTGTITWTAIAQGNYVASIKVEEYRNGALISHIVRDLQFIVIAAPSGSPHLVTSNWTNGPAGIPEFNLVGGQQFSLFVEGEHPDSTVNLTMQAFSPLMQDNYPNKATFSYTPAKAEVLGNLIWNPTPAEVRTEPYPVVFRLSDGLFSQDQMIYLNLTTSIGEVEYAAALAERIKVFPNPTHGNTWLQIDSESLSTLQLDVIDLYGRIHKSYGGNELNAGVNAIQLNLNDLAPGQYFIRLTTENDHAVVPIIKQ